MDVDQSGDVEADEFCDGLYKVAATGQKLHQIRMHREVGHLKLLSRAYVESFEEFDEVIAENPKHYEGGGETINAFTAAMSPALSHLTAEVTIAVYLRPG